MTAIGLCLIAVLFISCAAELPADKVKANNGVRIPTGYLSVSVMLMKKPSFNKKYDEAVKFPKDFSVNGPFFATGTALTRRWVLARATPVAYYPVDSYWVVTQRSIPISGDPDLMNLYEVDEIMLQPTHIPRSSKTDLVLVHTSKNIDFNFEFRNVNLGFDDDEGNSTLTNCSVAVWSWFTEEGKTEPQSLERGEMTFSVNTENCTDGNVCLSRDLEQRPCAINSGAPVFCNSAFVGIYVGADGAGAACDDEPLPDTYFVLRTKLMQRWLKNSLSEPSQLFPAVQSEEEEVVLKMCPQ